MWTTLLQLQICRYLRHMGYVREWDHGSQTPYAYKGDQWVGYDDNASVSKKVGDSAFTSILKTLVCDTVDGHTSKVIENSARGDTKK